MFQVRRIKPVSSRNKATKKLSWKAGPHLVSVWFSVIQQPGHVKSGCLERKSWLAGKDAAAVVDQGHQSARARDQGARARDQGTRARDQGTRDRDKGKSG